jgi:hypothetical protein
MSKKQPVELKSAKVLPASDPEVQGQYRWAITYNDGTVLAKYNRDNTKNIYADKGKVIIPLSNASSISLFDAKGAEVTKLAVPEGAVVFQRRRGAWGAGGLRINYYDRWHDVEEIVPGFYDKSRKMWVAGRTIIRHVPEVTYEECWIIGWRKREKDNSVTVAFDAVYPDGKVDHHISFNEKPWLFEPQWKTEEQV